MKYLSILFVALFALLAAPAQSVPSSVLDLATGVTAQYQIDFSGHFWNGVPEKSTTIARLTKTSAQTIHVVLKKDGVTSQSDGHYSGDGSLSADGFEAYNTVARVVSAPGFALSKGSSWHVTLPLLIGPSQTVDVPFTVSTTKLEGSDALLQGTGTVQATTTYSGFTMPYVFQARLAIKIHNNHFATAEYAATDAVTAGPSSQTMDWTWTIAAGSN